MPDLRTFFLIVVNLVYAFFETVAIIHAVTSGGPARATEIPVDKVFREGVEGLDLGGSSAQSVILMLLVIALTVVLDIFFKGAEIQRFLNTFSLPLCHAAMHQRDQGTAAKKAA